MAAETKSAPTNGNSPNPAATTLGVAAPTANGTGKVPRARRPSQLSKSALSLPAVESSLEEFIAKANQTLVDVNTWDKAEKDAKQEDAKRKEGDAQRWKATEQQMREAEVREMSLRRQLDGLQGKLAEAEARAAVAADAAGQSYNGAADASMSSLRLQVQQAEAKIREAELRETVMQRELVDAKRASTPLPISDDSDADERVRQAEAKAAKAVAAARAAAAGLTINPADLAALESGLPIEAPTQKKTPWLLIGVAFLGGLAIMFAVYKLALSKGDPAPVAAQIQVAPIVTPIAPTTPTVTPIEEPKKPAPAPAVEAKTPEVAPTPVPVVTETPKTAPEPTPAKIVETPKTAPKIAPKIETPKVATPKAEQPKAIVQAPTPKATPKATPKTEPKTAPKSNIADPFADPAPKKTTPPPAKKPAGGGGIVDPF